MLRTGDSIGIGMLADSRLDILGLPDMQLDGTGSHERTLRAGLE